MVMKIKTDTIVKSVAEPESIETPKDKIISYKQFDRQSQYTNRKN